MGAKTKKNKKKSKNPTCTVCASLKVSTHMFLVPCCHETDSSGHRQSCFVSSSPRELCLACIGSSVHLCSVQLSLYVLYTRVELSLYIVLYNHINIYLIPGTFFIATVARPFPCAFNGTCSGKNIGWGTRAVGLNPRERGRFPSGVARRGVVGLFGRGDVVSSAPDGGVAAPRPSYTPSTTSSTSGVPSPDDLVVARVSGRFLTGISLATGTV